jgi:hypothetical protein
VDEVLPETGVLCGDSRPTIRQQRDVAVEAFTDQAAAARWTMKWRCSSENPDRDKLTESTTADVTTAPGDTFESRADPNPCPPPERRARGHPCTRRGARTRGSVPPFRASARSSGLGRSRSRAADGSLAVRPRPEVSSRPKGRAPESREGKFGKWPGDALTTLSHQQAVHHCGAYESQDFWRFFLLGVGRRAVLALRP